MNCCSPRINFFLLSGINVVGGIEGSFFGMMLEDIGTRTQGIDKFSVGGREGARGRDPRIRMCVTANIWVFPCRGRGWRGGGGGGG